MARGRKFPYGMSLAPVERAAREHWQRATTIQAGLARRAKISLLRADGLALSPMAHRLTLGRRIVRQWIKRFLNRRLAGLADTPGRGRQPVFSPGGSGASGQAGL
jgi:Helix-turn-helix domain